MAETDEYVLNNSEGFLMDPLSMTTAYQKMKTLCQNLSSEIRTDIEIHNKHVLPRSAVTVCSYYCLFGSADIEVALLVEGRRMWWNLVVVASR